MRAASGLVLACGLAMAALVATSPPARAHYGRQYYGGWNYYPSHSYYYQNYYYQPYSGSDYSYHYCIYYPSQPQYVYYYNPSNQYYWGRLDLNATGEEKYALLAEKDRKKDLKDIPESAFPRKLIKMPPIPGSKDGVAIEPLKKEDLPKGPPPDSSKEKKDEPQ